MPVDIPNMRYRTQIAAFLLMVTGVVFSFSCKSAPKTDGGAGASDGAPASSQAAASDSDTTVEPPSPIDDHVYDENRLAQVIQPGDRILFVGDELTQQGLCTRAVMTALMAIMPDAELSHFNGGKEGATSASAIDFIDELLDMTEPTVVMYCLGYNDVLQRPEDEPVEALYQRNLLKLVTKAKSCDTVRQIVLISAPANPEGGTAMKGSGGYNDHLLTLAQTTYAVSVDTDTLFVGLFVDTYNMYNVRGLTRTAEFREAGASPSKPTHTLVHSAPAYQGRFPRENGYMAIASSVLKGLGVTPGQLEDIGWSPLPPVKMSTIRPALAIPAKAPAIERAQLSRELYEALRTAERHFFRAWRLAKRKPTGASRQELLDKTRSATVRVQTLAKESYSR